MDQERILAVQANPTLDNILSIVYSAKKHERDAGLVEFKHYLSKQRRVDLMPLCEKFLVVAAELNNPWGTRAGAFAGVREVIRSALGTAKPHQQKAAVDTIVELTLLALEHPSDEMRFVAGMLPSSFHGLWT